MNAGLTLSQLAAEVERQQNSKKDFKVPTSKLEVEVVDKNVALKFDTDNGGTVLPMTRRAQTQFAEHMKMPQKYFDMLLADSPDLLAQHMTARLQRTDDTRLVRTLDGNARAFLSNRYRMIDNYDVLNAALPTLLNLGGLNFMSQQVTDDRLYLKVVTPKVNYEVKKGDIVQGGIVLSNSEVGAGSIKIEPFFYRLVCTNGMISAEAAMRRYHVGRATAEVENAFEVFKDDTLLADDKAFMLKMRDSITAAFEQSRFERLLQPMLESTERRIERPIDKVVEVVSKKYSFTDTESGGILNLLAAGGDLSQWGLANAITAMANDEKNYERATQFERFGGDVVSLPTSEWRELAAA